MTKHEEQKVLAELKAAVAAVEPAEWDREPNYYDEGGWFAVGPHRECNPDDEDDDTDEPGSPCHKRAQADQRLARLLVAHAPALIAAAERCGEVERRAEELTDALHRDRTGLASALGRVVDSVKSRMWVTEGRGAYEWDDDRYKEEAGEALREAMGIALQALRDSGTIANRALNGKEPKPEGERDRAYIVTLTTDRDALAAKLAEVEAALRRIGGMVDSDDEDLTEWDHADVYRHFGEATRIARAALAPAEPGDGEGS